MKKWKEKECLETSEKMRKDNEERRWETKMRRDKKNWKWGWEDSQNGKKRDRREKIEKIFLRKLRQDFSR